MKDTIKVNVMHNILENKENNQQSLNNSVIEFRNSFYDDNNETLKKSDSKNYFYKKFDTNEINYCS